MSNFFLELVSPDKNYFVGNVDMVVLPGEEGDFSVLFDHAPIITFLRPGRVLIIEETGKEHLFFVAGGFVKVDNNKCHVMVDYIKERSELDDKSSRDELSDTLSQIESEKDENSLDKLFDKKLVLEEQLSFIENYN